MTDLERTQTMSNPSAEETAALVLKMWFCDHCEHSAEAKRYFILALQQHAAAAVAEEREACAQTAENSPMDDADYIAADIRKRGKPT